MDKNKIKITLEKLSDIIYQYVSNNGYYYDRRKDRKSKELFSPVDDSPYPEDDFQLKIDLLERTLEILRIEMKHLENNVPMEEFIQGNIECGELGIRFNAPGKRTNMGSGTKPIALQPKLLLYLLYSYHNGYGKVYDIIDNFIRIIWDHLEVLDFKKTRTGVLRCFTNTRFAALTLRDYGLLRFTKKEAYKTWVLSLPGILVASKVMEEKSWEIPAVKRELYFDLHPDIRNAFNELQTYDKFIQRLALVCKPDTKIFSDFKEGSKRAYSLMADYWQILKDSSISIIDRKKKSTAKLKQGLLPTEWVESASKMLQVLFYQGLATYGSL